jgi:hypothetical protein
MSVDSESFADNFLCHHSNSEWYNGLTTSPRSMSDENEIRRDLMGLFAPGRGPDLDARIRETEERLDNTRAFLERIAASEAATRERIADVLRGLEQDLERLRRRAEDTPKSEPPE